MADLHISERPADLATSDESDQSGLSLEAMDNTLPPEDVSSYHEPGLFIDFNDPPEVIAEELRDLDRDCDMLSDDDLDSDAETNSDTESSNGQSTNAASPESHNLDSSDLEGTSAQADEPEITHSPPASGPSNTRSSFSNLLDSLHAPGRGTYDIQCILEEGSEEMQGLKEQKAHIELLLAKAEQRCHEIRAHLEDSDKAFQALQEQNGISAELWREYEAFCESLEPQFGSRRGWSILCSEDHGNSYFQYDPDLTLLSQSAPISLQNHNFRCEAYTVVPTPQQQSVGEAKDCPEMQHVVKFWAVPPLKPRTGMETTWGDQYVSFACEPSSSIATYADLKLSPTSTAWRPELSMTSHDLRPGRPGSSCGRFPTRKPHFLGAGCSSISAIIIVPHIPSSQDVGYLAAPTRLSIQAIHSPSLRKILSRMTTQLTI